MKPVSEGVTDPLGEPLLTARQLAAHLSTHLSTVYRLAGRPDGIPVVTVGKAIRFRPADVRAFLERHTIAGVGKDRVDDLLAPRGLRR
jgi:excisionase family DNA binding protein